MKEKETKKREKASKRECKPVSQKDMRKREELEREEKEN